LCQMLLQLDTEEAGAHGKTMGTAVKQLTKETNEATSPGPQLSDPQKASTL
jgi:hypothetical protein